MPFSWIGFIVSADFDGQVLMCYFYRIASSPWTWSMSINKWQNEHMFFFCVCTILTLGPVCISWAVKNWISWIFCFLPLFCCCLNDVSHVCVCANRQTKTLILSNNRFDCCVFNDKRCSSLNKQEILLNFSLDTIISNGK